MDYQVHPLKDRPELAAPLQKLNRKTWPDFIINGDSCDWRRLYAEFGDFLLALTDRRDLLIGGGFTVPAQCNGEPADLPPGIEKIIENGLENREAPANTLIPIAGAVDRRLRGENPSSEILNS